MNYHTLKKQGFTLPEVLMVVSITAMLALLLLGVVAHVRESGRRIVCQSNLKQIALALQQYVADNNGYYPLDEYIIGKNRSVARAVLWSDAIQPYLQTSAIFHCPDNQLSRSHSTTDYLYNFHRLNVFTVPLATTKVTGSHEASIAFASLTMVNSEDAWFDAEGNYFYGGPPLKTSCGRTFWGSTIHNGGSNYSFMDGHVKWLTQAQMGEIECANGPLPLPFKD